MAQKPICVPVHEAHEEIEHSYTYMEFLKKTPQAYLVHAFLTRSDENCSAWQFGFYDRQSDRVVVFETDGHEVKQHPPSEVYKEPGRTIMRLNLNQVQIGVEETLHTIDARMQEAYKGELASKEIILMQTLPEWGTIWNITVLSLTFHIINFKIDVKTGKILSEQRESLTTMAGTRSS